MKKLSKKLLAVLLIVLMVGVAPSAELANSDLSVFLIQSKADDSIPDGYVGIYTAEDLYNIRDNLSGKYILMNDIDLSSYKNWTPIGISQNKPFEGVLDGNCYNISNLTINDISNLEYYGLFGCSKNAIFSNLSLSDVSININSATNIYVGAICGYFLYNSTVLSGFYVSGEINVKTSGENASVGGIFGDCHGLSYSSVITVENCIVSAYINIDATTVTSGSVIGAVGADVLNFSNCEANGQMFIRSSTKTNAAGNIGYANCTSYISSCLNRTNINIIQPQGEINVGGILGCSFVSLSSTYFSNCGNAGEIIVASDADSIVYAGGISGRTGHYLGDTSLIKCYNSAPINISGNSKDSTCFSGGLLGYAKSQGYYNIKIEDSFNCGNINVADCNTLYVGGMAAYTTSNYTRTARRAYTVGVINYSGCNTVYEDNFYGLSCSYCYYLQDVNMTKQASATMLTSEQLSNKSYLSTFDFDTVWTYLTDNSFSYSYPTLIHPYFCEWEPNEQTITGKLTGGSSTNKIKIDGTWYEYDTSVLGLGDTISKFAINENITCILKFGKIVACSKKPVNSTAVLSVITFNNVIYDATAKEYNYEKININLNITNSIKSTQYGTINTDFVAGYDVTFDKLVINVQDGDMLYFKDGLFDLGKTNELEIELDSPVTLKAGKVFNYNENIYAFINDDYKWGETETKKDAKIVAYAYNGDTLVAIDDQTVTFKNTTAENAVKNQAETDKKAENAAKLLDKTQCVIQNEFLSEIFTKDELKAISNALQCKVALYAATVNISKNETLEDKLIDKLLKKAGISKDQLGTTYTADISLITEVSTPTYGRFEVEFNVPMTYYAINNSVHSGIGFNISYIINGGKNIPPEKKSNSFIGTLTYADIDGFINSVQDIALDQIKNAYDDVYGKSLNKVCEMFFGETMTEILSKTAAKSYSHLTFSVMTFPAKQVKIHCPVDVYVYDADGNLCASVENNEITMTCDDIDIDVVGDEKYLTIYEGEYSIEVIATANDTMDITIEEYSSTEEMIRTVAFNDVELTPGDSFKTDINENYLDNEYGILKNDENIIVADSNTDLIHCVDPVEIIDREANCTENGEYHIVCDKCGETVLTGTIPATGHNDSDHNGICDVCESDLTSTCSHLCHSENGFMQFIWKIVKFIYRIFGTNQYCDCGMAHW